MAKNWRGRHRKPRIPFWKAVKRFGFMNSLKFELRKPRRYPRYPIWFIPLLISMVLLAIILYFYPIDYLPILFYILQVIVVSYLIFRLLKRFNRIRVKKRNLLRQWGLKVLSALISVIGICMIYYLFIFVLLMPLESLMGHESFITHIMVFGYQWNTPYIIPLALLTVGIGLLFIGAFLLFKFTITVSDFIIGRAGRI
ncbi:MAG: hypothetical protein R6V50_07165 [Thermoplasmatota archaeon]